MKILTWNVNGLRAILGKGFAEFLAESDADVVCVQEIKARPEQVSHDFEGYHAEWNSAERPGYSGTLTLSRKKPLSVRAGIGNSEHDSEGRVLTTEFAGFYVVNVYVPNSGRELARLDYRVTRWGPAFREFLKGLEKSKPVVFCGDMNVAHREIDLARPRENTGTAGFTSGERQDFTELLDSGFVDSFREVEPAGGHYTWWSYRAGARERNIGWRIDYVGLSECLRGTLSKAFILPDVGGSDHCPAGAVLR